jgi:zinc transport system substrate-binding protein
MTPPSFPRPARIFLAFLACGAGPLGAEPTRVAVSLPPYAWLTERIGGEHVDVLTLVEEGEDPHSFQPPPRRIADLGQSAVWFVVGMPFEEPLVEKLSQSSPKLLVIPVHEGIELASWEGHDHAHEHEHEHEAKPEADQNPAGKEEDHEHDHEHGELDPHVWLSPVLLKQQAHTVAHALAEVIPDHAETFEANAVALEAELDALHVSLTDALAPLKGATVYVFHPAYGYFARDYGLRQEAIESAGREPSAKQLTELIARAKADGVKLILAQPQFSSASAEKVARAIGGQVLTVNDLARDVPATLRQLAEAVRASR